MPVSKQKPTRLRIKKTFAECPFCQQKQDPDYKDYQFLSKFLTGRARITPSIYSGVCSYHQRKLSREIKRARFLALLPFVEKIV